MITGYNTDVKHGETVFHVQTEDKGLANPSIESVIYVKGQVLAAKRSSYSQLVADGKGEREIAAIMEHQHRTILAAIKAGRFDAKLEALATGKLPQPVAPARAGEARDTDPELETPDADAPASAAASVVPAAVETSAGDSGAFDPEGLTLDQVILEYLSAEAEQEQLVLVLDSDREIRQGRTNNLTLRAYSSKTGLPLAGVQVTVKMISTIAEPRTLLVAQTDDIGAIDLELEVPEFDRGAAALIITGASALGRAEIKQLL